MSERALPNAGITPIIAPFVGLAAIVVATIIVPNAVIEVSWADFIVITCMLGGWAAWMTGRAIASTWRPYWHVVVYMLPLALVVRWVHFALFKGTLLSLQYYLIDLVVVLCLATIGYRVVRAAQMSTQYRWLYRKTGAFTWRRAEGAD